MRNVKKEEEEEERMIGSDRIGSTWVGLVEI